MDAILLFLGVLATSLMVGMGFYLRGLKPSLFRVQLTFSETEFRRIVGQWAPKDRARFAAHFAADYAFLLVYAALGYTLGQYLLPSGTVEPGFVLSSLPWLLRLAAAFDCVENLLHQRFITAPAGELPAAWFCMAGIAAATKWGLVVGFLVLATAQSAARWF